MLYKIIFSDLDGTIGDDNYEYSSQNIAAIKLAKENGIDVVLCSGRTPISLVHVGNLMKIDATYAIGFNGGTVWDIKQNKALFAKTMPKELALEIISLIQDKTPATVGVYTKPNILVTKNWVEGKRGLYEEGITHIQVSDIIPHIEADVLKVLVIGDPKELVKMETFIKDKIKDRFTMVYTATTMLEFIPLNVNKGAGMSWLANHLGIPLPQTVGFGDNYNDMELIQTAGLGIAVANAVEPLKSAADFVTKADNNNSALAEVVDYIIQLNEKNKKRNGEHRL
ncbi:MAG: Cof-type HAD-IIB family hydrolase [Defluviitaleaceae bacterium]|nr:Cof-type HAD-IIB family hydrolase [Defluviitaleaceae bacterium]